MYWMVVTLQTVSKDDLKYCLKYKTTNTVEHSCHISTIVQLGNLTFIGNIPYCSHLPHPAGLKIQQKMILCELLDNDKPGQMITRSSSKGFTTDEMSYLDGNFTYSGTSYKFTYSGDSYITQQELKPRLELSMWRHEHL